MTWSPGTALPSLDHHQVIRRNEPVTTARCGDRQLGCVVGFRGAKSPEARVTDQDGARRAARLGAEQHPPGRLPSGLDPADGDDRVPDRAVAVVQVNDEDHFLPAGPELVPCDWGAGCRVVSPPKQVQPCLGNSGSCPGAWCTSRA